MTSLEKVMNNNDLRHLIFSYLRKKPRIACLTCGKCCVWDKKIVNKYIEYKYLNEKYKYDCIECYKDIDAYQIYMSKYL